MGSKEFAFDFSVRVVDLEVRNLFLFKFFRFLGFSFRSKAERLCFSKEKPTIFFFCLFASWPLWFNEGNSSGFFEIRIFSNLNFDNSFVLYFWVLEKKQTDRILCAFSLIKG